MRTRPSRARKPLIPVRPPRLTVIGVGTLGKALLAGVVGGGIFKPSEVSGCDRNVENRHWLRHQGMGCARTLETTTGSPLLLLAIKPQNFSELARALRNRISRGTTLISVMAGIPIERVRDELQLTSAHPVLRAMPNLNAVVRRSVTALVSSPPSVARSEPILALFQSIGKTVILRKEQGLDDFTAVGGSGPALVAAIMAPFIDELRALGLSKKEARAIACELFSGTADHLALGSLEPDALIRSVSSTRGTTAAALAKLKALGGTRALSGAIAAGARRARELARE